MPPTTWDIPTFARQQHDIDEIDAALPLLDDKRNSLLAQQDALMTRSEAGEDVVAEYAVVQADLEDVELQRRGRLLMARECEKANRRMLEDVSLEFLTKGEREQLGGLRVKLRRILGEHGE